MGLHTICNRLRKAKVMKPSFYKKELFERFMDEEKMYDRDTAYVSQILHNPVYAGNLTVADKPTKTMRSKKRQYIPYAEREIIYGTHEPIIEQSRWNTVQKIFYCCTKYRKFGKEGCSSHTIEARTVHEVVLADIQKHAGKALTDRKAMVTEIAERLNLQLSADKEQLSSIEHFAEQISGYAGITELNFKIINQLIEKILVSEPVEIDGQKIQRLTIHYKFIGALETLE